LPPAVDAESTQGEPAPRTWTVVALTIAHGPVTDTATGSPDALLVVNACVAPFGRELAEPGAHTVAVPATVRVIESGFNGSMTLTLFDAVPLPTPFPPL
jgi:hypothetical protein